MTAYVPYVLAAFEHQVESRPGEPAVASMHAALSFAELDNRSTSLAARLTALGADADDVVLVQTDDGISLSIAVLAVLKAGGAFSVLDPALPEQRLRVMRLECRAGFLVADASTVSGVDGPPGDETEPALAVLQLGDGPTEPRPPVTREEGHLAYVVFTSGSTGVPKAIGMPHRCLDNLIPWTLASTSTEPLRTLQFSATGFDVFIQEVFSAWSSGGCLFVPAADERHDLLRIHELLSHWRIERLFLPPIALARLADIAFESKRFPASLRHVAAAGEALRITPNIREMFTNLPDCRLHNHYGPAETHVVTAHTLQGPPTGWPGLPPIGLPITATTLRITDPVGVEVAADESGELHIGGVGVARGYLNATTPAKNGFMRDAEGGRSYRTGDLVRRNGDGELEFLSRVDDQVKVRGYRVELAEIESVLCEHPLVRECSVIAQARVGGGLVLAAYVVAADRAPKLDELRAHAVGRLPGYMVPTFIHFIEVLPISPNGKVDRGRLLAIAPEAAEKPVEEAMPSGPLEAAIADIWLGVLPGATVGRKMNFLELGGDSLSAAMILSGIRSKFGVAVGLGDFFAEPTVAGLAAVLADREAKPDMSTLPRSTPSGPVSRIPSRSQANMWFLTQVGSGNLAYSICFTVELPQLPSGSDPVAAAQDALARILARHDAPRSTFRVTPQALVVDVAPPSPAAIDYHDLRGGSPDEVLERATAWERTAANEALASDQPPLLKACLLCLDDGLRLVVRVHHLVFDGISIDLFAREFLASWTGTGDDAAPRPDSFYDLAAAESGDSEDRDRLAQWRRLLKGIHSPIDLPHQGSRPRVQSFRGARHVTMLDGSVERRIRDLAAQARVSAFTVYLALFGGFLGRLAGDVDVLVGIPVSGRDNPAAETVIGYFVRTIPVPIRIVDDPSVIELVERTWRASLRAQELSAIPFDLLVRELTQGRDLSRPPLMQTCLSYRSSPISVVSSNTAKFDLTLDVWDSLHGTELALEYNTDLWDAVAAKEMTEALRRGFTNAVAGADRRLTEVLTPPGQ